MLENGQIPDEQAAPSSPSAESRIDIQLDRAITIEWLHNRRDIELTGLVVAEQPIEAVSLIVKREVKALALYSRAASRQAFRLNLAQRQDVALGMTNFEVEARTQDGQSHRTAFKIATDPENPRAARVMDGPVGELPTSVKALVPILLSVELAAVDQSNVLHVRGWCVALTQIVAIQILIDDQMVAAPRLSQTRDDIAAIYQNYPNARVSGFSSSQVLPAGTSPLSITVEAIDLTGSVNRVIVPVEFGAVLPQTPPPSDAPIATPRAEPERDPRRTIFLHCDEATLCIDGKLVVSGWVVCATGIASVGVSLDGEPAGDAQLGFPRPDVTEEYPGIPQARYSGFRLEQQVAAPISGDHEIGILVRNGLDDVQTLVRSVTASAPLAVPSQPTPAPDVDPQEFRLQLDHPVVIDGVVPDPVIGRMVIEGWALARSGVEAIDVLLDGRMLGQAYYGTARRDVEEAFPAWADSFRSGYVFHCPPRVLETGTHAVRLQLRAKDGATFDTEFQIDVQQGQDSEDYATIRRRMPRSEIDLYQDILDRLACRPHFRLLLAAVGAFVPEKIEATLRSLGGQAYRDWQLLIVTDEAAQDGLAAIAAVAGLQDQVSIISADTASDALISSSPSNGASCLIGVLSPGDQLGCDALVEIAIARGLHAEAALFYADEDRVSPSSHVREPFFKPAWSPDLLLSTNYIGRPWFATTDLIAKAGITVQSLLAPQGDYDAVLRCTELTSRIHHLPKLFVPTGRCRCAGPGSRAKRVAGSRAAAGHPGRSAAWFGTRDVAPEANHARHGQGLHHHPHLCRKGLRGDLPGDIAIQNGVPQLRDHLHRQHPARHAGMEGADP